MYEFVVDGKLDYSKHGNLNKRNMLSYQNAVQLFHSHHEERSEDCELAHGP